MRKIAIVSRGSSRAPKGAAAACSVESLDELRARGVVVLTQAQIAVALQVSYRTISEMRRRGEISCFRVGKKLLRFRIEEAIKHMEARGGAAA